MAVKHKVKQTDYMYSSARVRSLENSIATSEKLSHLADAANSDVVVAALSDFGFELIQGEDKELFREETLSTVLKAGYAEAEKMVDDGSFMNFLRYAYDCHNIKSIIKCASQGVSCDGMLIPLGIVDTNVLKEAHIEKDYSCLPENMAGAVSVAEEAFAATRNPQKVDVILDKACFADMLQNAEESGIELAIKIVKSKIDLTNLLIAVRLSMMELRESALSILKEALIPGGYKDELFDVDSMTGLVAKLAERFEYSDYSSLCPYITGKINLSVLEREIDNYIMKVAKTAKYIPFGPEVLIGYLVALEYEVKNIRIILAGKDAGLSSEVIRERLRDNYA